MLEYIKRMGYHRKKFGGKYAEFRPKSPICLVGIQRPRLWNFIIDLRKLSCSVRIIFDTRRRFLKRFRSDLTFYLSKVKSDLGAT